MSSCMGHIDYFTGTNFFPRMADLFSQGGSITSRLYWGASGDMVNSSILLMSDNKNELLAGTRNRTPRAVMVMSHDSLLVITWPNKSTSCLLSVSTRKIIISEHLKWPDLYLVVHKDWVVLGLRRGHPGHTEKQGPHSLHAQDMNQHI